MSQRSTDPQAVVVEDEPDLADLYADVLREEYTVETVLDGEAALTTIGKTTDIVILDRRLPNLHGDEVLKRIRERGCDCPVVMVTAVDPDLDVADLPFESYLTKPVGTEELLQAVEEQLTEVDYEQKIRRYRRVRAKIELLSAEKSDNALHGDDRFEQLCAEADRLESDISDLFTGYSWGSNDPSRRQIN